MRVHARRARLPDPVHRRDAAARDASPTSRSSACAVIAAKCPIHRTLDGEVMFDERVERVSSRAAEHRGRAAARSCSTPRRPRRSTSTAAIDAAVLVPLLRHRRRRLARRLHASAATTCAATPARSRSPAGARTRRGRPARDGAARGRARRSACRRTPSSCSARCSRRRRSPPNYAIYPFVGLIEPGHEWAPSAREVEEVLELPLARRCAPATTGAGCCAAASRSAPTPTWSASTSSGARRPGSLADLLERVDAAQLT